MPDGYAFTDLTFPQDRSVLEGITIRVGRNESVALFGPNGGGKSSVMRVIAGTVPRARPLADVAYLPQTPYLFRGTVGSNLGLGLDARESERARELATEMDVGTLLNEPSGAISVGETQRICLARTLASTAPLLLLDEPLAPISAAGRPKIVDIIKGCTADRGLLWATHNLDTVRAFADTLIILDGGAILQEGPASQVIASPANEQVASILGLT